MQIVIRSVTALNTALTYLLQDQSYAQALAHIYECRIAWGVRNSKPISAARIHPDQNVTNI
jgi:hypothetical protein